MSQLSALDVALVGIEGEIGHEVVGDGIADELAGDTVEVSYEEVRLGFLLIVHRIVGMTDVLSAVHNGAELAIGEVGDEEYYVLHASGKGGIAAWRHLQLVTIEGFIGFGGGEEE